MKDSLNYEEIFVEILDCQVRKWRTKKIILVNVLWKNQNIWEAMWESKEHVKGKISLFFHLSR